MSSNVSASPNGKVIDIFVGPLFTYLTPVTDRQDEFCVFKVEVPAGVTVPLRSHADRETFYILVGELESLSGTQWRTLGIGDVLDVTGNMKHAFRNSSPASVSLLMTSTMRMGHYFLDVGRPVTDSPLTPPTPENLQHFTEVSKKYDYWFANAEENAMVGITLPDRSE